MDTEVPILIDMKLATDRQTDIHEQTVWLVIDKLRSICEVKEKETYTNSTPTYMIGTLKSSVLRQFMETKDRGHYYKVDVSMWQWCCATGAKFCILKSTNYKNAGILIAVLFFL